MRNLKLHFILILVIGLVSCKDSNKVKIGYLLPDLARERNVKEQNYFKDKIQSLGAEAMVASAEFDDQLQIEQANEMIEKGAKVLIVNAVNMNTAASIIRNAHEKNVKVIAYDRLIRNCDLDYYISFNNVQVGKLMAEGITRLKPEGNYVLLGGDKADLNAVLVKKGQMDVLKRFEGKIKIDYNVYVEDWSGTNAYYELKKYLDLSGNTPDAILSSYDGMSTACIAALKEYGLAGKVLISGQDAELEACRNIVKDLQTLTIYKPFKSLVEKAAEIAYNMATGKNLEKSVTTDNGAKEVPTMLLEPIAVDKSNIRNTIIADGFYTESQIYN